MPRIKDAISLIYDKEDDCWAIWKTKNNKLQIMQLSVEDLYILHHDITKFLKDNYEKTNVDINAKPVIDNNSGGREPQGRG
jgi:hypothetical protein